MNSYSNYTDEQINHLVANKIMGWTISDVEDDWGLCWITDEDGNHIMDERVWRPCKDMNQAFESVKRLLKMGFNRIELTVEYQFQEDSHILWRAYIDRSTSRCWESILPNPARALCEALLQAEEEK